MTRHLHVWCVVLERAAMVIRLMEQACTCCMMHGGAAIVLHRVAGASRDLFFVIMKYRIMIG